jgi:cation diffusion facilitator family transporter
VTTLRLQRYIAVLSVILFLGKLWAWYLTQSVSILTDALESTVNVIAGFIGLYSIILAAKPRDENHPYGHGKAEFVSAAVEGTLIMAAALLIFVEGIHQLLRPVPIKKLDTGIIIIAITGFINLAVGQYALMLGKKQRSLTVEAAGNHLRSDAYSTVAIIIGLILVYFTGWKWLDAGVALAFAVIIFITGYKVLRRSLAGIMDEADIKLLAQVVAVLQDRRRDQWIDLHNLRVIQYGDVLHIDAHMTLPYYYEVRQAESEINTLEQLIQEQFGGKVELFIHVDGCSFYQCKLCKVIDCPVRQDGFRVQVIWEVSNVMANSKHGKVIGETS